MRVALRWSATVALPALVLACSSSVPELRTYTYQLERSPTATYRGTLTIRYASRDSIAGRLDVPGLDTTLTLGTRNGDSYVLEGRVLLKDYERIGRHGDLWMRHNIEHTIERKGKRLMCEARVITTNLLIALDSQPPDDPASCALE